MLSRCRRQSFSRPRVRLPPPPPPRRRRRSARRPRGAPPRRRRSARNGSAEGVNRFTFVVQVHPEGIATLENLGTQERIRISDFEAVGPQIETWLAEQREARPLR